MQSDDSLVAGVEATFLDHFEAAGGWVNRTLMKLTRYDSMGYGAVATADIPVRS